MDDNFDMNSAVDSIGEGLFGPLPEEEEGGMEEKLPPEGNDEDSGEAAPAPAAAPATPTPAATPAPAPAATPTPTPAPSPADLNTPPKTWRAEAAAEWATLPEKTRAEVLKREEDMFRGLEQYKGAAQVGQNFAKVLEPYLPTYRQFNIDPVATVGDLLNFHHRMSLGTPEQKLEVARRVLSEYRIDPASLLPDPNAPAPDPVVQRLQSELQAIKSTLSERDTRDLSARRESLRRDIDTFAADPANAYFDELSDDIAQLLSSGVCKTLKDAYDKALWSNPVTRAKESTRLQEVERKRAEKEANDKAEAARKATAANVRSKARTASAAARVGSIDDTLKETLASIHARTT